MMVVIIIIIIIIIMRHDEVFLYVIEGFHLGRLLDKIFGVFTRRLFLGKKPTFRDYLSVQKCWFVTKETTPGKNPKYFIFRVSR
jgi:hypothetical protein